ncbi:hypothetical protein [Thalassomonas haliotis]|uniref:Uncharacterized protein n=1 Tax=Thalassomonas haliotis TaxID=485448 RepID=A0ABY7VEM3_9GAMM|nr:hypothetical protein [Thalassomonas haliotis]WDE11333.1 hypothetical protein H3N35_24445 [Thalassomonas haliotis]
MADLSNLETQLTAKIAALSGDESLTDLMILKKACEGTAVDTGSLETVIQSGLSGLDSAASERDLLIANRSAVSAPKALAKAIYDKPLIADGEIPADARISLLNTGKAVYIGDQSANASISSKSEGLEIAEPVADKIVELQNEKLAKWKVRKRATYQSMGEGLFETSQLSVNSTTGYITVSDIVFSGSRLQFKKHYSNHIADNQAKNYDFDLGAAIETVTYLNTYEDTTVYGFVNADWHLTGSPTNGYVYHTISKFKVKFVGDDKEYWYQYLTAHITASTAAHAESEFLDAFAIPPYEVSGNNYCQLASTDTVRMTTVGHKVRVAKGAGTAEAWQYFCVFLDSVTKKYTEDTFPRAVNSGSEWEVAIMHQTSRIGLERFPKLSKSWLDDIPDKATGFHALRPSKTIVYEDIYSDHLLVVTGRYNVFSAYDCSKTNAFAPVLVDTSGVNIATNACFQQDDRLILLNDASTSASYMYDLSNKVLNTIHTGVAYPAINASTSYVYNDVTKATDCAFTTDMAHSFSIPFDLTLGGTETVAAQDADNNITNDSNVIRWLNIAGTADSLDEFTLANGHKRYYGIFCPQTTGTGTLHYRIYFSVDVIPGTAAATNVVVYKKTWSNSAKAFAPLVKPLGDNLEYSIFYGGTSFTTTLVSSDDPDYDDFGISRYSSTSYYQYGYQRSASYAMVLGVEGGRSYAEQGGAYKTLMHFTNNANDGIRLQCLSFNNASLKSTADSLAVGINTLGDVPQVTWDFGNIRSMAGHSSYADQKFSAQVLVFPGNSYNYTTKAEYQERHTSMSPIGVDSSGKVWFSHIITAYGASNFIVVDPLTLEAELYRMKSPWTHGSLISYASHQGHWPGRDASTYDSFSQCYLYNFISYKFTVADDYIYIPSSYASTASDYSSTHFSKAEVMEKFNRVIRLPLSTIRAAGWNVTTFPTTGYQNAKFNNYIANTSNGYNPRTSKWSMGSNNLIEIALQLDSEIKVTATDVGYSYGNRVDDGKEANFIIDTATTDITGVADVSAANYVAIDAVSGFPLIDNFSFSPVSEVKDIIKVVARGETEMSASYEQSTVTVTIPACKFTEGKAWIESSCRSGWNKQANEAYISLTTAAHLISNTQVEIDPPNGRKYHSDTSHCTVYWTVLESK